MVIQNALRVQEKFGKEPLKDLKRRRESGTMNPRPQAKVKKGGKGKGGSAKGGSDKKPHKVPEKEWTALMSMRPPGKPRCPFWNSSHGCTFGEECKKAHICMECGGNHTWCSQHM